MNENLLDNKEEILNDTKKIKDDTPENYIFIFKISHSNLDINLDIIPKIQLNLHDDIWWKLYFYCYLIIGIITYCGIIFMYLLRDLILFLKYCFNILIMPFKCLYKKYVLYKAKMI